MKHRYIIELNEDEPVKEKKKEEGCHVDFVTLWFELKIADEYGFAKATSLKLEDTEKDDSEECLNI